MKRFIRFEMLTAFISILAVIVSSLMIGSEFVKISPNVTGVFVSILGVILGVVLSIIYVLSVFKKEYATIFISYSLKDYDFVLKLSNDLSRNGFHVLRIDNVVMIGDNIKNKINESIQKADFFLLVFSKESLESDWVLKELELALQSKKKIFPILKEIVPLPPVIASIKYADFTKEYDSEISALAKSLRVSVRSAKT